MNSSNMGSSYSKIGVVDKTVDYVLTRDDLIRSSKSSLMG
jgi:hypothetical protein